MSVPFEISFLSLTIKSFSIFDADEAETDRTEWSYHTEFKPDEKKARVEVVQRLIGTIRRDEVETKVVELTVEANFNLPPIDVVWSSPRPRIVIKKILAGLVASTCRGIILDRTAHTHLQRLMLPVMDPGQLFILDKDEETAFKEESGQKG